MNVENIRIRKMSTNLKIIEDLVLDTWKIFDL